jgi:hypothetical protein
MSALRKPLHVPSTAPKPVPQRPVACTRTRFNVAPESQRAALAEDLPTAPTHRKPYRKNQGGPNTEKRESVDQPPANPSGRSAPNHGTIAPCAVVCPTARLGATRRSGANATIASWPTPW